MPKIPEYIPSIHPDYTVEFRKPRSTIEAEKYRQKAQEKGFERTIQGYEDQRTAQAISFIGDITQKGLQFADQLIENEAARQLTNAEVMVNKRFDGIAVDLENNPYEEKVLTGTPEHPGVVTQELRHYSVWSEAEDRIKQEVLETITNPRAKKIFEDRYQKIAYEFGKALQTDARHKMRVQQRVDLMDNLEYWTQKGNMKKVNEYLSAGKAGGLLAPDEIDNIRDQSKHTIDYNGLRAEAYNTLYQKGEEDAVKHIRSSKDYELSFDDRKKLEKLIRTEVEIAKKAEAERHKAARTQQNVTAAQMYAEGKDSELWDALEKETKPGGAFSDLEGGDITKYLNMIESRPKPEEPEEKPSRCEVTEPEIEAKVSTYVNDPEKSQEQKARYIKRYHGEGLSTDDVNKYLDRIGWEERIKPKKEEEKSPYETTNPVVEAELLKMWYDPDTHDDAVGQYLDKYHGEGLSNSDFLKYSEDLKKRTTDIIEDVATKETEKYFEDKVKETDDPDEKRELNNEKAKAMKKLKKEYDEKPDLTDEQKQQIKDNVLDPYKNSDASALLNKVTFGFLGKGTEEQWAEGLREGRFSGVEENYQEQINAVYEWQKQQYKDFKDEEPAEISYMEDTGEQVFTDDAGKMWVYRDNWWWYWDNEAKDFVHEEERLIGTGHRNHYPGLLPPVPKGVKKYYWNEEYEE